MNFGEKIKNYRMENDYTQDEFAKLIGVSKRTLLLYEQGKRFPKQKEVYEKIAELMNCDYNFLIDMAPGRSPRSEPWQME